MSAKRAGEFFILSRNQLRTLMGLPNLNRPLFRLRLIDNHVYGRCKQSFAMALCVLGDGKALAALRFTHLYQHFLKPRLSEILTSVGTLSNRST
jgi:hypothetical protein